MRIQVLQRCHALCQELVRCKSSGLPPPSIAPTELGHGYPLAQNSALATSPTDGDAASSLVESQALAQEESLLYSVGASNATPGKPAGVADKECAAFKARVS